MTARTSTSVRNSKLEASGIEPAFFKAPFISMVLGAAASVGYRRSLLLLAAGLALNSGAYAQNVTVSGSNGHLSNTCLDGNNIPKACVTETMDPVADVNAATWTPPGPVQDVVIGTNFSGTDTGSSASGSVNIKDGATVGTNHLYLGFEKNTTGSVTVSGAGSAWISQSPAIVGLYGNGSLQILDGASVSSVTLGPRFWIGYGDTGVGTVTVSGVDAATRNRSTLISTDRINVGNLGSGTLNILDGGFVSSALTILIAAGQSGTGTVNVSGVNAATGDRSTLKVLQNQLSVGELGSGRLNVTDGGLVDLPDQLLVGGDTTGRGVAVVDGINQATGLRSTITSDTVAVGGVGQGELYVTNGGLISASSYLLIGAPAGVAGAVTVDGVAPVSNAPSTIASNDDVYVGDFGIGTLTIKNGGMVSSVGGLIGNSLGGQGTVTVSGADSNGNASTWINTGVLRVGNKGVGTLTIGGGGIVSASNVVVANIGGSTGTLILNGDASGRGVLETGVVIKGAGSASIDLNGGILRATRDEGNYLNGFGALVVGSGGAWFDTNAHNVTIGTGFSGSSSINKLGFGTLTLIGDMSAFTGTTSISAGTLQVGNSGASGIIGGNIANNGVLVFNRLDNATLAGVISGSGAVNQIGSGITSLTGANTYTGGTTISAGILQLGDGGTSGSIVGDVTNETVLSFNRSNTLTLGGVISGTGALAQVGTGTTVLMGDNSYTGTTEITRGALWVNGNQSAATGAVTVHTGATLGGSGTLGGGVTVQDGATLVPGSGGPGTLTMGALALDNASKLNFELGAKQVAGGALNDLIVVNGNLTLDGTLNIAQAAGGAFDPGVYRIMNYTGSLIDQTLVVNAVPAGSSAADIFVQKAIPNQVNLVNTSGLILRFWDGANPTAHNNGVLDGTSGTWLSTGNDNWTDQDPHTNGFWTNRAFAVFGGVKGTVAVDDTSGAVNFSGAQFLVDGYTINGPGTLTMSAANTVIRVGDGTAAGQAMTATLNSSIAGVGGLVKSDVGTLVLGGINSYTGGTAVAAGTLQISQDENLGAASGALAFDGGTLRVSQDLASARAISVLAGGGVIDTQAHSVAFSGAWSGAGDWAKAGAGTLTLSGTNTATGTATVAAGTLMAGAAGALGPSASYSVAAGATLDSAGFNQTVSGLRNAGTVSMLGVAPGTTLTVKGGYVGDNGVLRMGTALGGNASATDRLVIDGGSASGKTTVQVVNLGGLGAETTGNGIELISAMNGATTTAQTTKDAFSLAGGHVDAGAFEYRLQAGDMAGAGENWYLRTTVPGDSTGDAPGGPGTPGAVTYRPDVALNAALPGMLGQSDMSMLGTLHQRLGDSGAAFDKTQKPESAWGRFINENIENRQQGTVSPHSDGWATGMQLGLDFLRKVNNRFGLYGGHLEWDSDVTGYASGLNGQSVGKLSGHSDYAGLYWTHTADSGWYSDVVVQQGWQRGRTKAGSGNNGDIHGNSTLASVEVGKPFAFAKHWGVEPQAQFLVGKQHLDDQTIPAASIKQDLGTTATGRLGVRIVGDFQSNHGRVQPYGRFNVWHGFNGTDTMSVNGPGGNADIDTKRGYTSGDVAVGATWTLNQRVSLYGEVGRMFAMGGGQDVTASHTVSVGVRVAF